MRDALGRTIDYLRISVTDRCNLRCIYCMPPDGVEWKPHEAMLSFEETLRLCGLLAELGIRKIKITGGEPLVRRGVTDFIRTLKTIPGIEQLTLTTNGLLLDRYLEELWEGGIRGINISLDTLDPEVFQRITRRISRRIDRRIDGRISQAEGLPELRRGMDRALGLGIPVKVNCVPLRGINEKDLIPVASLAERQPIAVRFIELMPLGAAEALEPIPGAEVKARLEERFGPLEAFPGRLGNGPAAYYSVPGFKGKIGLINAISDGFCETCNRLRLSSQGFLKPCLAWDTGLDLRGLIRSGAPDGALREAMEELIRQKPRGHTFAVPSGEVKRPGMYTIGG
jgi:cyclic pyranopterin phosphate synthase